MYGIDYIIGKYLSGEATKREQQQLEQWLNDSEQNRHVFRQITAYWQSSPENLPILEQRSWENISQQISAVHKPIASIAASGKHRKMQLYWLAAAVFACLMAIGTYVAQLPEHTNTELSPKMVTQSVERGQKLTFHLSDGTKVKLNASSVLHFPEQFEVDTRRVRLSGEAFFDVASDPDRPFIIETTDADIVVLGTSFNVSAYEDKPQTSVAVVSGKVKVRGHMSEQEVVLNPEYMAEISRKNGEVATSKFDPTRVLAWKEGRLVFEGANMTEILASLEKWYGYGFETAPNLKFSDQADYYGVFERASLRNIMENLSYTYQFSFQIDHQQKKVMLMR